VSNTSAVGAAVVSVVVWLPYRLCEKWYTYACAQCGIVRKVKPNAFNCKQKTIDNVILVNNVSKFLYF